MIRYDYLHSSMDRFEEDLARRDFTINANLHSSMDRFEGYIKQLIRDDIQIYIPVWIDLKFLYSMIFGESNDIYIPVWIDLKSILRAILNLKK